MATQLQANRDAPKRPLPYGRACSYLSCGNGYLLNVKNDASCPKHLNIMKPALLTKFGWKPTYDVRAEQQNQWDVKRHFWNRLKKCPGTLRAVDILRSSGPKRRRAGTQIRF